MLSTGQEICIAFPHKFCYPWPTEYCKRWYFHTTYFSAGPMLSTGQETSRFCIAFAHKNILLSLARERNIHVVAHEYWYVRMHLVGLFACNWNKKTLLKAGANLFGFRTGYFSTAISPSAGGWHHNCGVRPAPQWGRIVRYFLQG